MHVHRLAAVELERTQVLNVRSLARPDELERRLQERLDAVGPARRAELLHVLMLPDFDRADRIGDYWAAGNHTSRLFAELLNLPGWLVDVSPFQHVPAMPSDGFALTPIVALTATAAVLLVAGAVGFRRRDAGY